MNLSKDSKTAVNLMRAFAGESQARNRYTFAAEAAKKQGLGLLERTFYYTANQEKEHAQLFYQALSPLNGQTITIDGGYPADLSKDPLSLLKTAWHNEFEEYETVYPAFAKEAQEEGFSEIAALFTHIAEIERTHGERFRRFYEQLEEGKLFLNPEKTAWLCLNCGHIHRAEEAPAVCPVCKHSQGYFVRWGLEPFIGA